MGSLSMYDGSKRAPRVAVGALADRIFNHTDLEASAQ
jgi:hypothetical protein